MEDKVVTAVNEQLENLEESPEDSNQVNRDDSNVQTSSDIAVDEGLPEKAPAEESLAGHHENTTPGDSSSTRNLN